MVKKRLFYKKSKSKFLIQSLLIIFTLFIIFIYLYYYLIGHSFFIFPEVKDKYYVIPKDKGGEKILNLDKKSLNYNKTKTNNFKLDDTSSLFYSIQFFVSSDYDKIILTLNNLTNNYENIYTKDDFYIVELISDLGIDYFLLYKNFNNREEAKEYCSRYLYLINNCLIVNVQNF